MASVYTNDLRLEEIGSGEQSGTWGDTTNTNLELIAESFSFGTEAITTNADTHTTTIADGATDPGRSMFLKYTGTLDSACTITIGPNTVSKLWFIENGTSGSQNIIISQGSGANITIPPGDTKAIYSDGAGSGAAMVDAFASLNVVDLKVQDDLTVTDDVAIGGLATVGETLAVTGVLTTTAATVFNGGFASNADSTMGTNKKLIFRDAAIHISSTADGDLSIAADDEIDITSTLIDVNGNLDVSGTALVTGVLTTTAATVFNGGFVANDGSTITTADNTTQLTLASTDTDANVGPVLDLFRNVTGATNDEIGRIQFTGKNDAGTDHTYANISSNIEDATSSGNTEDGSLVFQTIVAGSVRDRLNIVGGSVVINQEGLALDFRVESDGNAHMLQLDGTNNRVGIGHADPTVPFAVSANPGAVATPVAWLHNSGNVTNYDGVVISSVNDGSDAEVLHVRANNSTYSGGTSLMLVRGDGNVGIGTTAPEAEMHLAKSTSGGRGGTLVIENSHGSTLNNEVQIAFLTDSGAALGAVANARIKAINTDAGNGAADITFTTWNGSAEAEKMRIAGAGDVTVKTGNLVIGTAGKGIDFSNQAATGNQTAELLDHYEEGTWTPALASDASAVAYTTQVGLYTRIGSIVHMSATVQISDLGNFAGATVSMGGFPFIIDDATSYEPVGFLVLDGTANAKDNIFLRFLRDSQFARLEQANGQTTHDNNMNANAFDTGTILKMSGSYIVK